MDTFIPLKEKTMRINSVNLQAPQQSPYQFAYGQVASDPIAISNYFGTDKAAGSNRKRGMYDRQYEKAKRLERMSKRAAKASLRSNY